MLAAAGFFLLEMLTPERSYTVRLDVLCRNAEIEFPERSKCEMRR